VGQKFQIQIIENPEAGKNKVAKMLEEIQTLRAVAY